jgi:hypothetical protein
MALAAHLSLGCSLLGILALLPLAPVVFDFGLNLISLRFLPESLLELIVFGEFGGVFVYLHGGLC